MDTEMLTDFYGKMQTPCYVINKKKFLCNLHDFVQNFNRCWSGSVSCGYSVKTNNSIEMLKLAYECGMYAEVVSEHEYKLARKIGFNDAQIIYNGPVKGNTLLEACISGAKINIDNFKELEFICQMLQYDKEKYSTKIGVRLNFDLEAYVPGQTSTGDSVGRFGFCLENGDFYKAVKMLQNNDIKLVGIHVHYTTKTRSLEVFSVISEKLAEVINGLELDLEYIDIGGGFFGGRSMEGMPTIAEYAQVITDKLKHINNNTMELILEPGSAMCATVVDYLTRVNSVKDIRGTRIATVDGSLLHINPFLHKRTPMCQMLSLGERIIPRQEVCGATCLENDRLLTLDNVGEITEGDMLVFNNTGAYTMSFLSDFILEKPKTYLINECDNGGV